MSRPSQKELLRAVAALQGTAQEMFGAYSNDVAPNRAERMKELKLKAEEIAQPLIDRCPFEWLKGQGK